MQLELICVSTTRLKGLPSCTCIRLMKSIVTDLTRILLQLDRSIPEDIAFAESRIRGETVAAEDVLQDTGAISMLSSDSQAMGRIGEVVARTWRTASKMRSALGPLREDTDGNDNYRVRRYIAKYTINVYVRP